VSGRYSAIHMAFFFWLVSLIAGSQGICEAFGNNSLHIPKIGMMFFDNVIVRHKKPWGLSYQWTAGSSFMQAINYRWWWVIETNMGFGHLTGNNKPFVSSFSGGAGVRFNIFQDDFRPHAGLMVHYLHFLGEGSKSIPLDLGWPIFVGFRPFFGLEWLFYSEMSLLIDGSYGVYVNINEPFRQVISASLAFSLYF
jgi:hypothetical protein